MHLQVDRRVVTAQGHHLALQHAFALYRHQRRCFAERHAHLKARHIAHLVRFFLGQQVHAVVVLAAKPQLALLGHPHRCRPLRLAALVVGRLGNQLHLTAIFELGVAIEQALGIALATAHGAQVLEALVVLVTVKAPHHALARGRHHTRYSAHLQLDAGQRLASGRQGQRLKAQLFIGRCPVLCLDTRHHRSRPHHTVVADGLHLAVGVRKAGFQQQILWHLGGRNLLNRSGAGAIGIQRDGQLVGNHAAVIAVVVAVTACAGQFAAEVRACE